MIAFLKYYSRIFTIRNVPGISVQNLTANATLRTRISPAPPITGKLRPKRNWLGTGFTRSPAPTAADTLHRATNPPVLSQCRSPLCRRLGLGIRVLGPGPTRRRAHGVQVACPGTRSTGSLPPPPDPGDALTIQPPLSGS